MSTANHNVPSQNVLDDFGLTERPSRIESGEGRAYISGDVVLKPIALESEANWIATTLDALPEDGFRVERPVRTITGHWLSNGWSGWRRLKGAHDTQGRWDEVLHVTEAFHRALEGLRRPDFLETRNTPWDVGDRAAWGERSFNAPAPIRPLVDDVSAKLRPVDLPSQVIHGDMPRNVLFVDGLPPAVIDFSPYYRPAGFASAVVVVDALTWYGAEPSILDLVQHIHEIGQLLWRAVIYRFVTTGAAFADDDGRLRKELEVNRPTISHISAFEERLRPSKGR